MSGEPAVGTAMGLVVVFVIWIVMGVVVGGLARWFLPGPDTMSIGKTMLYGIGGSLVGGLVARAVGVTNAWATVAIGVLVAMLLIWFFRRRR